MDSDSVTADLKLFKTDPALPAIRNEAIVLPEMESVDRTSVEIAEGVSTELLMTIPGLDTGTHHGLITLVGDDGINSMTNAFTVQVLPPSKVLLVVTTRMNH